MTKLIGLTVFSAVFLLVCYQRFSRKNPTDYRYVAQPMPDSKPVLLFYDNDEFLYLMAMKDEGTTDDQYPKKLKEKKRKK